MAIYMLPIKKEWRKSLVKIVQKPPKKKNNKNNPDKHYFFYAQMIIRNQCFANFNYMLVFGIIYKFKEY